ncbi:hypothetical protein ABEB36_011438 [Hypothenemus hampei]|uniref:SGTA homodimerisation domain-containing protein n=1 Tax=Hypothenemus hampei TaxID=57062 RepID=A0ABD1EFH7_HYPHA
MDRRKQILINSMIRFLKNELLSSTLTAEKKESLEVAVQCLETTFEVETYGNLQEVDLLSFITDINDKQKEEAEIHKTKGNEHMKNSMYQEAIDEYTKAIELNPYNAIYFCNRAAAFTRLNKDNEAIQDCKEAIKLHPTYGKAHGRLGIAYSNLNKFDLAVESYKNAMLYDPDNSIYEANLQIAQERLSLSTPARDAPRFPRDISEFINNPNIINMANQVLSDQNFASMMSNLINNATRNPDGMPNTVEAMLQAGQALAERVVSEDPDFYNRVTRNINAANQQNSNDNSTNPETKPSGQNDPKDS